MPFSIISLSLLTIHDALDCGYEYQDRLQTACTPRATVQEREDRGA